MTGNPAPARDPVADLTLERLDGASTTLLIAWTQGGPPQIAHFGARLPADLDRAALSACLDRAPRQNGLDVATPAAPLLPTVATGHYRHPAIEGHRDGRAFSVALAVERVEHRDGGLTLVCLDPVAALRVEITLALSAERDVLRMATRLTNIGTDDYTVIALASGVFLAPPETAEALTLSGSWAREFVETREPIGTSALVRDNRRNRSHDRWPGIIVGEAGFTAERGRVMGVHLGWSGSHRLVVERLDDGRVAVHAGEWLHPGEVILAPGASLDTPTAYAALADGLDALAHRFTTEVRAGVLSWAGGRMRPRPVTLNTWEGNYFDHDLDHLKRQAEAAARLGIERFVLDDGWFSGRHDDTTSLGDWTVDPLKYPNGLGPLIDHVVGLGMEFGLWVEPEMVNPASDLFRAHPDWMLQVAGRPLIPSRHQLVLDIARADVADYLYNALHAVLAAHPIAYLKWDFNRDLLAAGDADGRAAYRAQVHAIYALIDRLKAAHPGLEIETCASGGGRIDYGMLARTDRAWTSDCTDALERLRIQRGYGRFLPPELMGAHVSASPNHQTGRSLSLDFRAASAFIGHFGVELNPLTLDDTERTTLAHWIGEHKRLRPLLHGGETLTRDPVGGRSLTLIVAPTRDHAVAVVAQETLSLTEHPAPLRVPGLDPAARYRLRLIGPAPLAGYRIAPGTAALLSGAVAVEGAVLAAIGIRLPDQPPQSALVIEFTKVQGG